MGKIITRITSGIVATAIIFSSFGLDAIIDDLSGAMLVTHAQDALGGSLNARYGSPDGFTDGDGKDTRIEDGVKYYNTGYGLHTDKTVSSYASDGRTFDLDLESWYVGENPADVGMVLDASGSMAWTTNVLKPLDIQKDSDLSSAEIEELRSSQESNGGYLTEEQVEKILKPENTDSSKILYDNYSYYVYESRPSVSEFVPLGFWEGNISRPASSIGNLIGYYPFDGTLENKAVSGNSASVIADVNEGEKFTDTPPYKLSTPDYEDFSNAKHEEVIQLEKTANNGAILLDVNKEELLSDNSFSLIFQASASPSVVTGNSDTDIVYIGDLNDTSKGLRFLFNKDGRLEVRYGTNIIKTFEESITTKWQTFKFTFDGAQLGFYLGETFKDMVDIPDYDDLSKIDDFGIIVGGLFSGANYDGIKNLIIDNVYLFNKLLTEEDVKTLEDKSHFGASTSADVVSGNLNSFGDYIVGLYSFDDYSLKNQAKSKTTSATYIGQNSGNRFDRDSSSLQVAVKEEYSESNGGYKNKGKSLSLNNTGSNDVAVKLDAKPNSDKYTISFAIMINNTSKTNADANVLYVGDDQDHYYRAFRAYGNDGSSRNHFRINEKDNSKNLCNLNDFFKDQSGKWQIVTYVVDGNTITPYKNGEKQDDSYLTLDYSDDISIIVAGLWDNLYNRNDIFLDELYVYDEALSAGNVKELYEIVSDNNKNKAYNSDGNVIATISENLIGSDISNRRGWYYVNSGSDWEIISDPNIATAKAFKGIKYEKNMKSGNHIYDHANIPSAYDGSEYSELKDLIKKVDSNFEFNNLNSGEEMHIRFYIDGNNMLRCFFNSGGDTASGNFGNGSECRTQCSLVFFKPAQENIKTESLNEVLNSFVGQLQDSSGNSKISAVRFSNNTLVANEDKKNNNSSVLSDYADNLKKLVLLDWVSKNDENNKYSKNLAGIRDGFYDSSTSTVGNLNNYFLTGGTNTWVGLKSFYDNLNTTDLKSDGKNKYLIVFTDGRDTLNEEDYKDTSIFSKHEEFRPEEAEDEGDQQLAKQWADKLGEEGYTIFCVMLSTGSIAEGTDAYRAAHDFLTDLASKDESVYDPKNEGELQEAFSEILGQIAVPLSNYTIQDYIDPRFDLVTYSEDKKNGTVLHLGAGGRITDENNTVIAMVGNAIKGSGAKSYIYTTKDGKNAYIYFDDVKDMYYLRWTAQSIPGSTSTVDTKKDGKFIDVWSSTITIKAKNDFIGGNAVLTNGNEAGMNLVFSPQTIAASEGSSERDILSTLSGFDRAQDKGTDGMDTSTGIDYPSKGFPRTTVNVRLMDINTNDLNDVIYLGEVVSPTQMLADLEDDYMTDSYYLEYLGRYAYRIYGEDYSGVESEGKSGRPLIDLFNKWLKINDKTANKKSFTVPYMYLPDPEYDDSGRLVKNDSNVNILNNSGTETSQKDILGILTYRWERIDSKASGVKDITDDFTVTDSNQIKYRLLMKFTPLKATNIDLQSDESYVFIRKKSDEADSYLNKSDLFFDIDKGEFTEAKENDADDARWNFHNRSEYNGALVVDDSYEWDSIYKSTQGYEQVELNEDYGKGEKEDGGLSLSAQTIYTKDVVNAGLALELFAKGKDLSDGTKVTGGKQYTFTATRKYDDPFDPDPYGTALGADVSEPDGEQYQLTFTVDGDTLPTVPIDNDTYYSVWANLTGVKKIGDSGSDAKLELPIGTYAISLPGESEDRSQFLVNSKSGEGGSKVYFSVLTAESSSNPEKFNAGLFPGDVTGEPQLNDDYKILNGTVDNSKENAADIKQNATDSATFYFGTVSDEGAKGNRNVSTSDYIKDRLGIIVLTYGDNSLTISKEVTDTKDQSNFDREWTFEITLKPEGAEDLSDSSYTVRKVDALGNVSTYTISFEKGTNAEGEDIYTQKVKLKHGEKITILQLPNNIQYSVSEVIDEADKWKFTPYIGTTDNQTDSSVAELLTPASSVHFINQFNTAMLPSSGGSGGVWFVIAGSTLALIGLTTIYIVRKRMRCQAISR